MSAMPSTTAAKPAARITWRDADGYFHGTEVDCELVDAAMRCIGNIEGRVVAAALALAPSMPFPHDVEYIPPAARVTMSDTIEALAGEVVEAAVIAIARGIRPKLEARIREAVSHFAWELHAETKAKAKALEAELTKRAEEGGGLRAPEKLAEWELMHHAAGVVASHITQGLDIEEAAAAAWLTMRDCAWYSEYGGTEATGRRALSTVLRLAREVSP